MVGHLEGVLAFRSLPPAARGGEGPVLVACGVPESPNRSSSVKSKTRFHLASIRAFGAPGFLPVDGAARPEDRRHSAGADQRDLHAAAAGVAYRHGDGHVLQGLQAGLSEVGGSD